MLWKAKKFLNVIREFTYPFLVWTFWCQIPTYLFFFYNSYHMQYVNYQFKITQLTLKNHLIMYLKRLENSRSSITYCLNCTKYSSIIKSTNLNWATYAGVMCGKLTLVMDFTTDFFSVEVSYEIHNKVVSESQLPHMTLALHCLETFNIATFHSVITKQIGTRNFQIFIF